MPCRNWRGKEENWKQATPVPPYPVPKARQAIAHDRTMEKGERYEEEDFPVSRPGNAPEPCRTFPCGGSVPILESASGFYYIEAEGRTSRLSAASQDKFMQVDGEWFKDLNGNGELDVYEDWRADVSDRVADLLSQMTINEKAGSLFFSGIGGKNGIVVSNLEGDMSSQNSDANTAAIAADSEILTSHEVVVSVNNSNYSPMAFQIQDMGVTTFIAAMTGTPKDQLDLLNAIQKIGEEGRLGIPIVFSGDRSYNTWGGMIDMAHYAFGVAHDEELLYDLVSEYAKESVALGYHQVFHGYGNEIGSWYGDEVNYISEMSVIETRAYDDNGFNSHSKHYIARGGRSNFAGAQSPADLWESWMVACRPSSTPARSGSCSTRARA